MATSNVIGAGTTPITVKLPSGDIFRIQARQMGGKAKVGIGTQLFSDLTNSIEGIASSLIETVKKVGPSKATVEFGVEAAVESGKLVALLCSGDATANLKITLEWETSKK
jgi:hypothetical protein